jgi:NAD-specific glutamate dehydrogenase
VAEAFFVVGERLYLDVIEERVSELPGRSRWQRLAWTTMVDDLRLLRRQIATRVVVQGEGMSSAEAVDRYLSARVDPYQRLARLMETFSHAPDDETALITVIVHQIRQVVA